ncbi:MAG TPA: DUF5658 family protein [Steroidobacteraceae bacterium]|nr:DUF5658 family protein [Steroidobacteraceae bacterium]
MATPFPPNPDDWLAREPQGAEGSAVAAQDERRNRPDRRRRVWWSAVYGSFRPRRRQAPRRSDEARYHAVDWHEAHLLAVSIGILILSVADAFLTVTLMSGGAIEVNPVMAMFVKGNVAVFAGSKMTITGVSVMLMVFLARYRFMRLVRVDIILYCILVLYVVLIAHEIDMLHRLLHAHAI